MTTKERMRKTEKKPITAMRRGRLLFVAAMTTWTVVFLPNAGCAKPKMELVSSIPVNDTVGDRMSPSVSGTITNEGSAYAYDITVNAIFSNSPDTCFDLAEPLYPAGVDSFRIDGEPSSAQNGAGGPVTLNRLWATFDY